MNQIAQAHKNNIENRYDHLQLDALDFGEADRMRLLADWILISDQPFNIRKHLIDANEPMDRRWVLEQKYISACEYLVGTGMLQHVRNERGWYQPVNVSLNKMDLESAVSEPVDIWLPFGMSDMVEIYEGNIAIFAGAKSSGKTSIALNLIKENQHKFDEINYFNSEMGAPELKKRLELFNRTIDMWECNFYSRYDDFHAAVRPGVNTLNIIDFLEIHDEFYKIGAAIKAIHDALNGSVCVIFLQKNPGSDVGLGGWRSIEVARLYVAMEKGTVKITDAKNWVDPEKNPNGLMRDFTVYKGSQINTKNPWYREKIE